jgi:hypothetical protein
MGRTDLITYGRLGAGYRSRNVDTVPKCSKGNRACFSALGEGSFKEINRFEVRNAEGYDG